MTYNTICAIVKSENFKRRHLNEAQRISIAKQLTGWHVDQAKAGRPKKEQPCSFSKAAIAQLADVSERAVQQHNAIERTAPALLAQVESGAIGLAKAEKIGKTVAPDVLATAPLAALQAAINESPEARCQRMVKAAQSLADEWRALSLLPSSDLVEIARADVRFILSGLSQGEKKSALDT